MTGNSTSHAEQRVFVALGANLGEPLQQLDTAVEMLQNHPEITCVAMSKVYASKPHGPQDQPDYTNAVLELYTTLSPHQLLACLQQVENDHGRQRKVHWGARTLDLDIILFADVRLHSEDLTIPHPRSHEREFVVQPLADLDADVLIPPHGNVGELLKKLPIETMEIIRDVTTYNR